MALAITISNIGIHFKLDMINMHTYIHISCLTFSLFNQK